MKILLTGCGGFVGSSIAKKIDDQDLVCITRNRNLCSKKNYFLTNEFSFNTDFSSFLTGVDVVIHCAAKAHITTNKNIIDSSDFFDVNTHATLKLAKQSSDLGVKRFVFISSIGVNGLTSTIPFKETDPKSPHNDYARSKSEAENGLMNISSKSNMEVVIIRPPLIYGPNAPGNFRLLLNLIKKGYPLPFGSVTDNKRSFIALDNLVDFVLLCSDYKKSPKASNQIFVVSDGDDVSTAELLHRIAKAYGKKSRLLPFPCSLLKLGGKMLGKQFLIDRLLGSLQVDSSKARNHLGWAPVIMMNEQLRRMAEADKHR